MYAVTQNDLLRPIAVTHNCTIIIYIFYIDGLIFFADGCLTCVHNPLNTTSNKETLNTFSRNSEAIASEFLQNIDKMILDSKGLINIMIF